MTKQGGEKINSRHRLICANIQTGLQVTHVFLRGYLVPMGNRLVTPAHDIMLDELGVLLFWIYIVTTYQLIQIFLGFSLH